MSELLDVPPAAGNIEVLKIVDDRLVVHGWMFEPGRPFETIEAFVDGADVGPVPPSRRRDIETSFGWMDGVEPSVFTFEHPLGARVPARVDVVGGAGGTSVARLSCLVPWPVDAELPEPPIHLQERVAALHGPMFRAQGLRMYTDLADQMTRRDARADRILDWGSGCGRVTRHLMVRKPDAAITGCDIDPEGVAWCQANLRGRFVRVDPMPPTPFADGEFDCVLACSVLTHLAGDVQDAWLAEMRRLLAPGGWLFASTQGEYAYRLAHRPPPVGKGRAMLRKIVGGPSAARLQGLDDRALDPALDGVAPPGYYRGVYQSEAHTVAAGARHFEVVDYLPRGLAGHQDLVVLRRAA
jgi:SAM-dependent methyltransferase